MQTIALVYHKIMPNRFYLIKEKSEGRFLSINQEGLITLIMLSTALFLVIVYITSIFLSFGLGFSVQENSNLLSRKNNDTVSKELKLQKKYTGLLENNKAETAYMEKITSIKYITTSSFTAYRLHPQP